MCMLVAARVDRGPLPGSAARLAPFVVHRSAPARSNGYAPAGKLAQINEPGLREMEGYSATKLVRRSRHRSQCVNDLGVEPVFCAANSVPAGERWFRCGARLPPAWVPRGNGDRRADDSLVRRHADSGVRRAMTLRVVTETTRSRGNW